MNNENNNSSQEMNYASKKILDWYKRDVKTLSIFTEPFNSNFIFVDLITDIIKDRKNVLYVSGEDFDDSFIVNKLKRQNKYITYSKIREGTGETKITFCSYFDIHKIGGEYELVILDDISCFSKITLEELKEFYEAVLKLGKRIIVYSMEPVTVLGERIEISSIKKKHPYVEPRIITTRIDLNKDIPYILYDYLKWFKENKSHVMIYVPSYEKLESTYNYYNKLKLNDVKVMKLSRKEEEKTLKDALKIKDKAIFIITDYMEDNLEGSRIDNAIVLFADKYNYKSLIYLCGKIGSINNRLPEVIFVSKDVNNDMDKVRDFTRVFNKKIWERKLKIF